jgi:hypothetical protein
MKKALLAVAALAIAGPAAGASIKDPICTDRPGKSSSTCSVPKGHWQVESGLGDWSLTKDRGTRSTELVLGETSFKYGVSNTMHIEMVVTPYVRDRERTPSARLTVSGFGDITLLIKKELATGDGPLSAALYPYVKLPTAPKRIGNGKAEAGLIVPLSYSIGGTPLSISASPEIDLVADGDGHGYHPGMAQVISLGVDVTDNLSFGSDLWGSWDWDHGSTTRQATVGGNAAYRIGQNWQIDGEIDFGLNRATSDVEISAGISRRF